MFEMTSSTPHMDVDSTTLEWHNVWTCSVIVVIVGLPICVSVSNCGSSFLQMGFDGQVPVSWMHTS